jgi:LmbE family N-acetylglucosaminyl deacetylase
MSLDGLETGERARRGLIRMMGLSFCRPGDAALKVLCFGAHSDDIEIGCGGTILRLLQENPGSEVCWVVLSALGARRDEATRSAGLFLENAGAAKVVAGEFRDGYFPHAGADIKDFFETIKRDVKPDIVLTHHRDDRHQDHRLVSNLTWNTFRDHLVLEYEVPKYDGDLGRPNFFVEIGRDLADTKIRHLMQCFGTQRSKSWFTEDTFRAMLTLRGVECRARDGYAEAFHSYKIRF